MIKSGIVRKRFHFFVWELLTNEKKSLIIKRLNSKPWKRGITIQFYSFVASGYNQGRIISLIVFTKTMGLTWCE